MTKDNDQIKKNLIQALKTGERQLAAEILNKFNNKKDKYEFMREVLSALTATEFSNDIKSVDLLINLLTTPQEIIELLTVPYTIIAPPLHLAAESITQQINDNIPYLNKLLEILHRAKEQGGVIQLPANDYFEKRTLLHSAALNKKCPAETITSIIELLATENDKIQLLFLKDSYDKLPIHCAVESGNIAAIEAMLKYHKDEKVRLQIFLKLYLRFQWGTYRQVTALHAALYDNNLPLIKTIIESFEDDDHRFQLIAKTHGKGDSALEDALHLYYTFEYDINIVTTLLGYIKKQTDFNKIITAKVLSKALTNNTRPDHQGAVKLILDCLPDDKIKADLITEVGMGSATVFDIDCMLNSIKDQNLKDKIFSARHKILRQMISAAIQQVNHRNNKLPIPASIIIQIKRLLAKMTDQEKFDLLYATNDFQQTYSQWAAYQATLLYELQSSKNWEAQLGILLLEPPIDFTNIKLPVDVPPPANIKPPLYMSAPERYKNLQERFKPYNPIEQINNKIDQVLINYSAISKNKQGRRFRYRERRGAQLKALEYAKTKHIGEGTEHKMAVIAAVYHSLQTETLFGEKIRFMGKSDLERQIENVFPEILNIKEFSLNNIPENNWITEQNPFFEMLRAAMRQNNNLIVNNKQQKNSVKEADRIVQHLEDVVAHKPVHKKS